MKLLIPVCLLLFSAALMPAGAAGQEDENAVADELSKAKRELTKENYLLRYKYQAGETITYH